MVPFAKDYRHPTSQEGTKTNIPKTQEHPSKTSERDTTLALSVKTNTEWDRPHGTTEVKKNVEPGTTIIDDPKELVEVPRREVAFFAKTTYRAQIGIG